MAGHSDRMKSIFGALELSTDSPLQQEQTRSHSSPQRASNHVSSGHGNRYEHSGHHRRESNRKQCRHEDDLRVNTGRGRGGRHGKRVPDHVAHPERWTRYDLEQDRASEEAGNISDEQKNTLAAMSFLTDLKKRRTIGRDTDRFLEEEGREGSESHGNALLFKRPRAVVGGDKSSSSRRDVTTSRHEDLRDEEEERKPVFRRPALLDRLSDRHRRGNNGERQEEEEESREKKSSSSSNGVTSTWNHARVLPEYEVGAKMDPGARRGRRRRGQVVSAARCTLPLGDGPGSGGRAGIAVAGGNVATMDHILLEEGDRVAATEEDSERFRCDPTTSTACSSADSESDLLAHDRRVTCESTAPSTEVMGLSQSSHDGHMTSEQPSHEHEGHLPDLSSHTGDVGPDDPCMNKDIVTFKKTGGKGRNRGIRSQRNVCTD